jgi:hypothetical protein
MKITLILVLLTLASCAGVATAPEPRGSVVLLNPTKWEASTNDLTTAPEYR